MTMQADETILYFSAVYFRDALCNIFAAQETFKLNACLPHSTTTFAKSTYTITTTGDLTDFNVVVTVYNDALCTDQVAISQPKVTPSTGCGSVLSDTNFFGRGGILTSLPTTFPKNGTILT